MIEMSREEIFIAGWWLCSEIFLKRPMVEGKNFFINKLFIYLFILRKSLAIGLSFEAKSRKRC